MPKMLRPSCPPKVSAATFHCWHLNKYPYDGPIVAVEVQQNIPQTYLKMMLVVILMYIHIHDTNTYTHPYMYMYVLPSDPFGPSRPELSRLLEPATQRRKPLGRRQEAQSRTRAKDTQRIPESRWKRGASLKDGRCREKSSGLHAVRLRLRSEDADVEAYTKQDSSSVAVVYLVYCTSHVPQILTLIA